MRVRILLIWLMLPTPAIAITASDTSVDMADGVLTAIDVRVYTSGTATWQKPSYATRVHFWCVGGGGGGGSGARNTSTLSGGGGGGGSGVLSEGWFRASDLDSSLSIVIGAGGTGGLSVSSAGSSGNNGIDGGRSYVGDSACIAAPTILTCIVYADSGAKGNGGSISGAAAGGTYRPGSPNGRGGGSGSLAGAGGAGGGSCSGSFYGPAGGGGGSGGNSTTSFVSSTSQLVGCQNGLPAPTATPASGSTAPSGASGTNLTGGRLLGNGGMGGGGGYGATFLNGGPGGNGGQPGGGGGGGGGSVSGTSGAGGNGGDGICWITSYR